MLYTVTTPTDLLLLLGQHQYLTIFQICKLLGKETTINNIREKLKKLVSEELVETVCLPRTSASGGRSAYLYSLSKKGMRAISDTLDVSKKSGVALEHTKAINDVAVLAQTIRGDRSP